LGGICRPWEFDRWYTWSVLYLCQCGSTNFWENGILWDWYPTSWGIDRPTGSIKNIDIQGHMQTKYVFFKICSNNCKQYKIIDKFSLYYRFDKNSKPDKGDYSIYTANYVRHYVFFKIWPLKRGLFEDMSHDEITQNWSFSHTGSGQFVSLWHYFMAKLNILHKW
jgi:hypothetical protein